MYAGKGRRGAYTNGLLMADSSGWAAGKDPEASSRDNPYKRVDYQQSWLAGFLRARRRPEANSADG